MNHNKVTFSFHPLFYIFWSITLIFFSFACFHGLRNAKIFRKTLAFGEEPLSKFQRTETPVALPKKLLFLPSGEQEEIVLGVKRVEINGETHPYNTSMIKGIDGYYWLFFRYDKFRTKIVDHPKNPIHTFIGMAKLDASFNHINTTFTPIDTDSLYSEDPRIFAVGKAFYLVYNDMVRSDIYSRSMRLAAFDPETYTIDYSTNIDQHISPIEKNWIPFAHGEKPYFAYQINPHKIMRLRDTRTNSMEHLLFDNNPCFSQLGWKRKWGTPRGGTPAQLVDGDYLAFFHSSFFDKRTKKRWYVMGAYTFEATAPFRLKAISPYPILYQGIYDTPHEHTGNRRVNVVFPGGFVFEHTKGKDLIHVSCGENDCGTKIITLDKKALLRSLVPIPTN